MREPSIDKCNKVTTYNNYHHHYEFINYCYLFTNYKSMNLDNYNNK